MRFRTSFKFAMIITFSTLRRGGEERIRIYKLREDRADVIVPAATIFMHIMEHLNIDKLYVPKVGLGDGMIHEMYEKVISKKQSKKK